MPVEYPLSDECMVFLIATAESGRSPRKLAAKALLACLRARKTPEEISACLDEMEADRPTVAEEARVLAAEAGVRLN